ncbi:DNA polymerase alpha/epsilon subunit B-domain-containing protein [Kalaharituber pfeilii]|nr:DNA polymerase alpha/epsilon subunit B-domain-containing protein [Kalaharituber pfeilii]
MPLDKGKARQRDTSASTTAPLFRRNLPLQAAVPTSSSAALTSDPFVPLSSSSIPHRPRPPPAAIPTTKPAAPRILAADIPPSALRPLAFRIFTKKHNLTLKSDALALLCTFIGRRCGSEWRDSGSGEKLLDEIARIWKRNEGPAGILVDGGDALKSVLKGLEVPNAGGGKGVGANLLTRQQSFDVNLGLPDGVMDDGGDTQMSSDGPTRDIATQDILGPSAAEGVIDPRKYLRVVDAFRQPKWVYNPSKKHFERGAKPSLLPPPQTKTQLFKQRYHLLHQRLLRNDSFLPPTFSKSRASNSNTPTHYTLTPISHLLGQSSSTTFLLFGLLTISPSGILNLVDPTGSIHLDLTYATPVPQDGSYFTPGCFVVVDGTYTEDPSKFTVLTIGHPPCERREHSAEVFGHIDFLGTGVTLDPHSAQNKAFRKIEHSSLGDKKFLFLSDVELDVDRTFKALRAVFNTYVDTPPLVCVLMGNFIRIPFGGSTIGLQSKSNSSTTSTSSDTTGTQGSLTYKDHFDALASLLSDFPSLLHSTTFVFVPGDHDPFSASFSGGRSGLLPREPVPEYFVNRVKRVLASGSSAATNTTTDPETRGGIWTSNPCRINYFSQDIVVLRDDARARLGRHALRFRKPGAEADNPSSPPDPESMDLDHDHPTPTPPPSTEPPIPTEILQARKLTKTILDQAHLSPHPLSIRPLLWDFSHTLSLYPLPHTLVLADPSTPPFAVTYEGCHVLNPGKLVDGIRGRSARWVEYGGGEGRGVVREAGI